MMPPVAHSEVNKTGAFLLIGGTAVLLDAFSTWIAVRTGHFHEQTPATANLIASFGLATGLAMSVVLRVAAFATLALVAECIPRLSRPLVFVGFLAVALTWLTVLSNISTLAAGS
jgi:hypothetical protein